MSNVKSGRFVKYKTGEKDSSGESVEAVGLALLLSSNERGDGSKDDYVEVVGPLPVLLLNADDVRDFNSEPEEDGSRIVGSSSETVGGLDMENLPDDSKTGSKTPTKKG